MSWFLSCVAPRRKAYKRLSARAPLSFGTEFLSVKEYMMKAKATLDAGLPFISDSNKVYIITGNESADMDSFVSALIFGYLTMCKYIKEGQESVLSEKKPSGLTDVGAFMSIINIPRDELMLRPDIMFILEKLDLPMDSLIFKEDILKADIKPEFTYWGLTDHNKMTGELAMLYDKRVVSIIDHHEDEGYSWSADPRIIEVVGSCTSLVTQYFKEGWLMDEPLWPDNDTTALLCLAPLLIDTYNFTLKVTDTDIYMRDFLLELLKYSNYILSDPYYFADNYYMQLIEAKRNVDNFTLRDHFRKDYKEWTEWNGLKLGMCSLVVRLDWIACRFSDEFWCGMESWAVERNGLDVVALLTAFDVDGMLNREVLLWVRNPDLIPVFDKVIKEMEYRFTLMTLKNDGVLAPGYKPGFWAWSQLDTSASRKQIGPFLRGVLQNSHIKKIGY
ncbi:uncharacterized protein V1510DRAFT_315819 [Dipodascopsis tothii]|uniref:uncharacterized protein n=1 Tax=Dipodascopsis tothii TaxID=44089 RepID=UPI0034CFE1C4